MDYFDELDFEAIICFAGISGMAEEEFSEERRRRRNDYGEAWEARCTEDLRAEEPLDFGEDCVDDEEPYEETDCDSCPMASGDSPESCSSCKYRRYHPSGNWSDRDDW